MKQIKKTPVKTQTADSKKQSKTIDQWGLQITKFVFYMCLCVLMIIFTIRIVDALGI